MILTDHSNAIKEVWVKITFHKHFKPFHSIACIITAHFLYNKHTLFWDDFSLDISYTQSIHLYNFFVN